MIISVYHQDNILSEALLQQTSVDFENSEMRCQRSVELDVCYFHVCFYIFVPDFKCHITPQIQLQIIPMYE
jgi:hypothetical protein